MSASKNITNILIIVLLLAGVILFSITKILERSNNKAMEYTDFQLNSSESIEDTTATIPYELLGHAEDVVTKTYSFIVSKDNHTEETILRLAKKVYREHCKTDRCTMNIFDNKRAYELYLKRLSLIQSDWGEDYGSDEHKRVQNRWDKRNYAFIANHLISVYYYGGDIFYYPYKDDYYLKLVKQYQTPKATEVVEVKEVVPSEPITLPVATETP